MTATWTDRAACRGVDTEMFYPIGHEATAALTICGRCPVREDCLDHALTHHERGIWGGKTEPQRRTILRRTRADTRRQEQPPPESKPCTSCGQDKPLTDFYTDRRNADGRQGRCKACHLAGVSGPADRVEVTA